MLYAILQVTITIALLIVYFTLLSRGLPRRDGPPAWGLGEVLTTPPCKTLMLRNIHMGDDRWRTIESAVMNLRVP